MEPRSVGRPRMFDRELALRGAASLFWRHGYSGTSTRALAAELGISSSSLYAAFGSKAELFEEAVRTYAARYSTIYEHAVAEPRFARVVERLLVESAREFTRTQDGHPGCLTTSAVMSDAPESLDVRTHVAEMQRSDEDRLRTRIEQAVRDGDVPGATDPATLAGLVQTMWHGMSVRAELGAERDELVTVAEAASTAIAYAAHGCCTTSTGQTSASVCTD